jgi:hypothetical protein
MGKELSYERKCDLLVLECHFAFEFGQKRGGTSVRETGNPDRSARSRVTQAITEVWQSGNLTFQEIREGRHDRNEGQTKSETRIRRVASAKEGTGPIIISSTLLAMRSVRYVLAERTKRSLWSYGNLAEILGENSNET